MLYRQKKASLYWPFFLIQLITLLYIPLSLAQDTHFLEHWKKLNYYNDTFLLATSSFLTSKAPKNTSIELELASFIKQAKQSSDIACRYPARYTFLYHHGLLDRPIDDFHCPLLTEYLEKVPVEKFYYVFAAENITSVTSMMGHGFLMAEGVDNSNILRQHTYAYFAELNSLNPIYLFYGAMVSGLNGRFALHPYRKDLRQYLEKEKREVWRYQLDLNQEEIQFLKLVLWELKDVDFTYHFHSFNCATLLLHVLATIKPNLSSYEVLFVSPLDISKALESEHLVKHVTVTLPTSITVDKSDQDLQHYQTTKQPTLSPQDSLISLYQSSDELNIALLPTSHLLRTPSSYRNAINALIIGYIDYNLTRQSLNEFTLYSFKDYQPGSDSHYASEIYIGYRPNHLNNININNTHPGLEYLIGYTRPISQVQASALIGFSHEKKSALDAKITLSMPYLKNGIISYTVHNKQFKKEYKRHHLFETSFMLRNKTNLYIRFETLKNTASRTQVGVDFHF